MMTVTPSYCMCGEASQVGFAVGGQWMACRRGPWLAVLRGLLGWLLLAAEWAVAYDTPPFPLWGTVVTGAPAHVPRVQLRELSAMPSSCCLQATGWGMASRWTRPRTCW